MQRHGRAILKLLEGVEGGFFVEMVERRVCIESVMRLGRYFSLLYINFGLMVDENKGNEI